MRLACLMPSHGFHLHGLALQESHELLAMPRASSSLYQLPLRHARWCWAGALARDLDRVVSGSGVILTLACIYFAGIVVASGGEPSFHLIGFLACVGATAARAFKSVLQSVLMSHSTEKLDSMVGPPLVTAHPHKRAETEFVRHA